MQSLSNFKNPGLNRLLNILTPEMGKIITKSVIPKSTLSTENVVDAPFESQYVDRWRHKKPMALIHMALWEGIGDPTNGTKPKWSKGALIDVRI